MRNSARKTFHFRPNSAEVLGHLIHCGVCLSRLTGALEGTVGLDALALIQHIARCAEADISVNKPNYKRIGDEVYRQAQLDLK